MQFIKNIVPNVFDFELPGIMEQLQQDNNPRGGGNLPPPATRFVWQAKPNLENRSRGYPYHFTVKLKTAPLKERTGCKQVQ
ncbi:MAG: hypothetical protein OEM02_14980 [Desulfobulbaceae bacterium]|nr:hypothetical protein [Desulfobulbaceae bacterium]